MANSDFTQVHNDDLAALFQEVSRLAFISEMLEKQIAEIHQSLQQICNENSLYE